MAKRLGAIVLLNALLSFAALAAPPQPPDLTAGGTMDADFGSWNLGATGASGWIWCHKGSTAGTTQIYVTEVAPDSPAATVLQKGDVILGAGTPRRRALFQNDARKEFAAALTEAETAAAGGKLMLSVWRDGKRGGLTVPLPILGSYSRRSPFNCEKSERIAFNAIRHLKANGLGRRGITASVNALALLATGDEAHLPMIREYAQQVAKKHKNLEVVTKRPRIWEPVYANLFLTEYLLATGDSSVLPTIREISTKLAASQSDVGSWGHSIAQPDAAGRMVLGGYGAVNPVSLVAAISMVLAQKCGIDDPAVERAVKRTADYMRYYVDKGSIPYGDHYPWMQAHDDNGKCSMAAVLFDLMGDTTTAAFFSRMTVASYNDREEGHTGNYFSFLWGALGAARVGDDAASAFMQELQWYYDLERQPESYFTYQGKPARRTGGEHSYGGWDCTGARLLHYNLPSKKLYLTGRDNGRGPKLTGSLLENAISCGRYDEAWYHEQSSQLLLKLLGTWSPIVRERAAMALAKHKDDVVAELIAMLDSNNRYARYGACAGLRYAGRGSTEAADALLAKGIHAPDATMRYNAMMAFTSRDKKMGMHAARMRVVPALLQLAASVDPTDPRRMLQNELGMALFYTGGAQPYRGVLADKKDLQTVDRTALLAAVREILKTANGRARSTCAETVFKTLTPAELKLMWPDIYEATILRAPSGIMFSDGVRLEGLKLMAENQIEEGLELTVAFLREDEWGRGDRVMKGIPLLKAYGAAAKPYVDEVTAILKSVDDGKNSRATNTCTEALDYVKTSAPVQLESIAPLLRR